MAVLVEANSVIVQVPAIAERFAGGWAAFADDVPNSTLCSDGEIARVGFMNPNDGSDYIDRLVGFGLVFMRDGRSVDIAVALQNQGLAVACDWLDYGQIEIAPGQGVSAVWRKGSASGQVFCPEQWRFERSLSRQYAAVPPQHVGRSLTFLRHDNGLDVYRDALTGKEVFIGRPKIEPT
ncbi:MAG TPA: hypothetical protein VMQ54_11675 [Steroidobacteraceae bacterium]|nr:hypothetical protein [Steroidobacteraceae bacterium]